eukprot:NODE_2309_length_947_cov_26.629176_g1899_i0.p4 GENE.NODE_2309_length_947_cov_26.629176_g1899_i0~~NODE_2309_length_947_cov_26.629176_g1899_i0.p4  ORF type:complete len:110 (-),score=42.56 NODE_2309_length_947_cov_26.629176_g1899_i0:37-366(-)
MLAHHTRNQEKCLKWALSAEEPDLVVAEYTDTIEELKGAAEQLTELQHMGEVRNRVVMRNEELMESIVGDLKAAVEDAERLLLDFQATHPDTDPASLQPPAPQDPRLLN